MIKPSMQSKISIGQDKMNVNQSELRGANNISDDSSV